MTTDLATVQQLTGATELSGSDRVAAEAYNIHRASASAWERFQTWANADDPSALPSTPQAVALYLGHLAAAGRSMASIAQARVAISHFHAAAGMQKGDNPAAIRWWPRPSTGSARFCASPEGVVRNGRNHRKLLTSAPPWT